MTDLLSVTISGDALDSLEKLAEAKGKTVDQVLGDAVALEQFVTTTKAAGGRLYVMDDKGNLREVAVP